MCFIVRDWATNPVSGVDRVTLAAFDENRTSFLGNHEGGIGQALTGHRLLDSDVTSPVPSVVNLEY